MVIVKFTGGVGNQLFAYAAGRALAKRLKTDLRYDTRYYLWVRNRTFRLPMFHAIGKGMSLLEYGRLILRPRGVHHFTESTYFSYDQSIEALAGDIYLDGWWQNPKYFADIGDILRKELSFRLHQSKNLKKFMTKIRGKTTISVHVRRGDYTKLDAFGTCSMRYYARAIAEMRQRLKNPTFVFFSDDVAWVRQSFPAVSNAIVVSDLAHEVEDLYAMSACTHHIIANSTFSWWGSVLAKDRKGITIAPTPWVNYEKNYTSDLYMKNWIVIPRD